MNRRLLPILILVLAAHIAAAQSYTSFWQRLPAEDLSDKVTGTGQPAMAGRYILREADLVGYLNGASTERYPGVLLQLPAPDGSFRTFRVWKTPVMEPELAAGHPEIATYTAEAVGASLVTAKVDLTPFGFHALVFDGVRSYLIDPSGRDDGRSYRVYSQQALAASLVPHGGCGIGDGQDIPPSRGAIILGGGSIPQLKLNGGTRRRYRLALACTGDYAVYTVGTSATKSQVLAHMVTDLNRTVGVFERELAVSFQLVANELSLISLDATTDPYSGAGPVMTTFTENQRNIDSVIGSANYDLGHLMTTSGGYAGVATICDNYSKAWGFSSDIGAATYLLLCHEIGHQLGAQHTFNTGWGACGGNAYQYTAFEPNSGSTIMSYAGNCGPDNLQAGRDNYFHSNSLDAITTVIGILGTCATTVGGGLNASIPAFLKTYSIPVLTPFELTAPVATVLTKDTAISYCWEQQNLGDFQQSLANTSRYGPLFRSYPADTSRTRVFPDIRAIIGKAALNGEKLPVAARSMTFRLVERNLSKGWGSFNIPDDSIVLNVIDTKRAFSVTTPAGGEQWPGGSSQAVSWDVAGTTASPISCANVDIYLSLDSGYTYPILLKANTANDGTESVRLPGVLSRAAKVKVKCSNNVFFNVSGAYFSMTHPTGVAGSVVYDGVRLFPVPARRQLNIEVPETLGTLQLEAWNSIGQVVFKTPVSGHYAVDVSGWPQGIYHLTLQGSDGVRIVRKAILE